MAPLPQTNSIKIIGDHTDKYIQAYFAYDSKKLTVSTEVGDKPIRSTYFIAHADFVACHNPAYVNLYDLTADLKTGGTFLLNCQWKPEELEEKLPAKIKRDLAVKKVKFYIVDAISIAKSLGLGGRTNTVLQSAFFKLANIIPAEDAIEYMKKAAYKSFIKKGQAVVDMNYAAIDAGVNAVVKVDVPAGWADAKDGNVSAGKLEGRKEVVDYVEKILIPVNAQQGDKLPVSAFADAADGTFPQGSAAYEKRGVAVDVPSWNPDNCIQCTFCSYVCPHATIRPVAMPEADAENYPGMKLIPMTGMPGYKFGVTVAALDCVGCGSCVQVCPGKKGEKALSMKPAETQYEQQKYFEANYKYMDNPEVLAKFSYTVKVPVRAAAAWALSPARRNPYANYPAFGTESIANATVVSIWAALCHPYTK